MKILPQLVCLLLACLLTSCAGPGAVPANDVPALAVGAGIVVLDVRQIIESEAPTSLMAENLIADLDALVPLISDEAARQRLQTIIVNIRNGIAIGLAIKAVVEGNVEGLRDLRDLMARR